MTLVPLSAELLMLRSKMYGGVYDDTDDLYKQVMERSNKIKEQKNKK